MQSEDCRLSSLTTMLGFTEIKTWVPRELFVSILSWSWYDKIWRTTWNTTYCDRLWHFTCDFVKFLVLSIKCLSNANFGTVLACQMNKSMYTNLVGLKGKERKRFKIFVYTILSVWITIKFCFHYKPIKKTA